MKTPTELRARAERFYDRYGIEIEQIADLLAIKLRQLALAYTIEHNLPREAVRVTARVKTLSSFLRKLERQGWPSFYYPTEVVKDLIGARIVVWFLSDAEGILESIRGSHHFEVVNDDLHPVKNYIANPQPAGYRAIHIFTSITYDRIANAGKKTVIVPEEMLCEVQIRTRLQDAWADITHEFFYKAKDEGVAHPEYESLLADISERLCIEDKTFIKFRDAYQRLADEKEKAGRREGFRDEDAEPPTDLTVI